VAGGTSVEEDPRRIVLWMQIYTAMELGPDDAPRPLSADEVEQRRQRLMRMGGSAQLPKRTP
jgi:hypothetical protein